MARNKSKNLSEKRVGTRNELAFIEGETQFCSQIFGVSSAKQAIFSGGRTCSPGKMALGYGSILS